jgi:hypothetical protein
MERIMKKLGFVALFFIAFAFVLSAQVTTDNESFTVSASVGKFVDIKTTLTDLELGDLTTLIGGETGASDTENALIRANTAWKITASAAKYNLTRYETSAYLSGDNVTIPYTFVFDGTTLITAGAQVASGVKSYTGKTNGYGTFAYSVSVAAADLNVNLDAGYYQDVITLTVAAQ